MESKITSKMELPGRLGVSCPSPLSVCCWHLATAGNSVTSKATRGVERGQKPRTKTELVEERDTEPQKDVESKGGDGRAPSNGRNLSLHAETPQTSKKPARWDIPVIPALERLSQEDPNSRLEISLPTQ